MIRSHNAEYGRLTPPGQWVHPVLFLRKIERAKHLQFTFGPAMDTAMDDQNRTNPSPQPPGIRLAPGVRVRDEDLSISFVRSSGPGGQNVNKRSTKAQLRISLSAIPIDERAMKRLRRLAGSAVTSGDELIIERDETRSQSRNRSACIDRLCDLIARAVIEPKLRRATKPSKGSVRRRLDSKTRRGEVKRMRKPPRDHD